MPDEWTSSPERTGASQGSGALSAETITALREAIRRELTDESRDGDLFYALRELSREARSNGLHGEHVVIALKQIWGELPEVWQGLGAQDRRERLEQLVTLCIEEFYAQE